MNFELVHGLQPELEQIVRGAGLSRQRPYNA